MAPPATERGMTFYLVGSEAQAQLIDQAAREAAFIQGADLNLPADNVYVVVVNDDESLRKALMGINDINGIRAQSGLSDPKVIDLRALAP